MYRDSDEVLKLDDEIRQLLGDAKYYELNDRMDFTKIMGLNGNPRYRGTGDTSNGAAEEWPMDLAIREVARAMASTGTMYSQHELPMAIMNAYAHLIDKSNAAQQQPQR